MITDAGVDMCAWCFQPYVPLGWKPERRPGKKARKTANRQARKEKERYRADVERERTEAFLLNLKLQEMNERSHREYLNGLRRLENAESKSAAMRVVSPRGMRPRDYIRDDPGNPLGKGFPVGLGFRRDGESHRQAWARVLRLDPCGFCGERPAGTLEHIEPHSRPVQGLGGAHSWTNFAGACQACNGSKGSESLLMFLAARAGCPGAGIRRSVG